MKTEGSVPNAAGRVPSCLRRAGAAAIDGLLIGAPIAALAVLHEPYDWAAMATRPLNVRESVARPLFAIVAQILVGVVYHGAFVAWSFGTPGKRLFGLRVEEARAAGRRPSAARAFARSALIEAGFLLTAFGSLAFALVRHDQRRLEDWVCGTRVVQDRPASDASAPRSVGEWYASALLAALLVTVSIRLERWAWFEIVQPMLFPAAWTERVEREAVTNPAYLETLPPEQQALIRLIEAGETPQSAGTSAAQRGRGRPSRAPTRSQTIE